MHDEVSETENIRQNLAIERMIIGGCDILLDVNQGERIFIYGNLTPPREPLRAALAPPLLLAGPQCITPVAHKANRASL